MSTGNSPLAAEGDIGSEEEVLPLNEGRAFSIERMSSEENVHEMLWTASHQYLHPEKASGRGCERRESNGGNSNYSGNELRSSGDIQTETENSTPRDSMCDVQQSNY